MRAVVLVTLAGAVLAAPGCAARDCSDVGGVTGLSIDLPVEMYVATGSLEVEVCDDRCATATQRLVPVPGPEPSGRGPTVSFDDLGRTFEPGLVDVTIVLRDDGAGVVARRTDEVELERRYPNGKACDGDGFVGGSIRLTAADRVA